jgi:Flp pilus assembly protein CpaB
MAVAAIGAVGVFVLVTSYLADVRSNLGPMVSVVAAAEDLPPFASPDGSALAVAEVPQRWLPPNSITDPSQIGDRVTAAAVPAGTVLSAGMFLERPAISPGEREIAILVDAETGVGGKLTSGAIVDIFATFEGDEDERPSVRIVVQRAEIIEVGSPVDMTEDGIDRRSVGFGSSERIPVTFRLSVEDARTLAFVESFATSVRLALRSPLDDDILPGGVAVFIPRGDDLGRQINPVPRDGASVSERDDAAPGPEPEPEPDRNRSRSRSRSPTTRTRTRRTTDDPCADRFAGSGADRPRRRAVRGVR